MDKEQLRSLTLAFLMIGSVMLGLFFIGVETDVSDRPPAITGENPGDFLVGEVTSVTVTVTDESVDEIYLEVSLNNAKLPDTYLDKNGQYVVDITGLNPGTHSLSILARDYLNQEANWETQFTISYPDEGDAEIILDNFATTIAHGSDAILSGNLSHTSIETCDFVWSDSDIEQEQLNVPMGDDGLFSMVFSELNENLTITMEANCGENIFSTDKTTINYIVEKQQNDDGNSTNEDNNTVQQPNDEEAHRAEFWNNSLHCHGDDITGIDDYNTTDYDNHICALDYEYNETHIVIQANGIPAHDLESGPGCCTASQDHAWTIPLEPTNNSECTPSISSEGCEMAQLEVLSLSRSMEYPYSALKTAPVEMQWLGKRGSMKKIDNMFGSVCVMATQAREASIIIMQMPTVFIGTPMKTNLGEIIVQNLQEHSMNIRGQSDLPSMDIQFMDLQDGTIQVKYQK